MTVLRVTRHDAEHELELLEHLAEHGPTAWTALPGGICVALHLMRLYAHGHIFRRPGKPWRAEISALGREYLTHQQQRKAS